MLTKKFSYRILSFLLTLALSLEPVVPVYALPSCVDGSNDPWCVLTESSPERSVSTAPSEGEPVANESAIPVLDTYMDHTTQDFLNVPSLSTSQDQTDTTGILSNFINLIDRPEPPAPPVVTGFQTIESQSTTEPLPLAEGATLSDVVSQTVRYALDDANSGAWTSIGAALTGLGLCLFTDPAQPWVLCNVLTNQDSESSPVVIPSEISINNPPLPTPLPVLFTSCPHSGKLVTDGEINSCILPPKTQQLPGCPTNWNPHYNKVTGLCDAAPELGLDLQSVGPEFTQIYSCAPAYEYNEIIELCVMPFPDPASGGGTIGGGGDTTGGGGDSQIGGGGDNQTGDGDQTGGDDTSGSGGNGGGGATDGGDTTGGGDEPTGGDYTVGGEGEDPLIDNSSNPDDQDQTPETDIKFTRFEPSDSFYKNSTFDFKGSLSRALDLENGEMLMLYFRDAEDEDPSAPWIQLKDPAVLDEDGQDFTFSIPPDPLLPNHRYHVLALIVNPTLPDDEKVLAGSEILEFVTPIQFTVEDEDPFDLELVRPQPSGCHHDTDCPECEGDACAQANWLQEIQDWISNFLASLGSTQTSSPSRPSGSPPRVERLFTLPFQDPDGEHPRLVVSRNLEGWRVNPGQGPVRDLPTDRPPQIRIRNFLITYENGKWVYYGSDQNPVDIVDLDGFGGWTATLSDSGGITFVNSQSVRPSRTIPEPASPPSIPSEDPGQPPEDEESQPQDQSIPSDIQERLDGIQNLTQLIDHVRDFLQRVFRAGLTPALEQESTELLRLSRELPPSLDLRDGARRAVVGALLEFAQSSGPSMNPSRNPQTNPNGFLPASVMGGAALNSSNELLAPQGSLHGQALVRAQPAWNRLHELNTNLSNWERELSELAPNSARAQELSRQILEARQTIIDTIRRMTLEGDGSNRSVASLAAELLTQERPTRALLDPMGSPSEMDHVIRTFREEFLRPLRELLVGISDGTIRPGQGTVSAEATRLRDQALRVYEASRTLVPARNRLPIPDEEMSLVTTLAEILRSFDPGQPPSSQNELLLALRRPRGTPGRSLVDEIRYRMSDLYRLMAERDQAFLEVLTDRTASGFQRWNQQPYTANGRGYFNQKNYYSRETSNNRTVLSEIQQEIGETIQRFLDRARQDTTLSPATQNYLNVILGDIPGILARLGTNSRLELQDLREEAELVTGVSVDPRVRQFVLGVIDALSGSLPNPPQAMTRAPSGDMPSLGSPPRRVTNFTLTIGGRPIQGTLQLEGDWREGGRHYQWGNQLWSFTGAPGKFVSNETVSIRGTTRPRITIAWDADGKANMSEAEVLENEIRETITSSDPNEPWSTYIIHHPRGGTPAPTSDSEFRMRDGGILRGRTHYPSGTFELREQITPDGRTLIELLSPYLVRVNELRQENGQTIRTPSHFEGRIDLLAQAYNVGGAQAALPLIEQAAREIVQHVYGNPTDRWQRQQLTELVSDALVGWIQTETQIGRDEHGRIYDSDDNRLNNQTPNSRTFRISVDGSEWVFQDQVQRSFGYVQNRGEDPIPVALATHTDEGALRTRRATVSRQRRVSLVSDGNIQRLVVYAPLYMENGQFMDPLTGLPHTTSPSFLSSLPEREYVHFGFSTPDGEAPMHSNRILRTYSVDWRTVWPQGFLPSIFERVSRSIVENSAMYDRWRGMRWLGPISRGRRVGPLENIPYTSALWIGASREHAVIPVVASVLHQIIGRIENSVYAVDSFVAGGTAPLAAAVTELLSGRGFSGFIRALEQGIEPETIVEAIIQAERTLFLNGIPDAVKQPLLNFFRSYPQLLQALDNLIRRGRQRRIEGSLASQGLAANREGLSSTLQEAINTSHIEEINAPVNDAERKAFMDTGYVTRPAAELGRIADQTAGLVSALAFTGSVGFHLGDMAIGLGGFSAATSVLGRFGSFLTRADATLAERALGYTVLAGRWGLHNYMSGDLFVQGALNLSQLIAPNTWSETARNLAATLADFYFSYHFFATRHPPSRAQELVTRLTEVQEGLRRLRPEDYQGRRPLESERAQLLTQMAEMMGMDAEAEIAKDTQQLGRIGGTLERPILQDRARLEMQARRDRVEARLGELSEGLSRALQDFIRQSQEAQRSPTRRELSNIEKELDQIQSQLARLPEGDPQRNSLQDNQRTLLARQLELEFQSIRERARTQLGLEPTQEELQPLREHLEAILRLRNQLRQLPEIDQLPQAQREAARQERVRLMDELFQRQQPFLAQVNRLLTRLDVRQRLQNGQQNQQPNPAETQPRPRPTSQQAAANALGKVRDMLGKLISTLRQICGLEPIGTSNLGQGTTLYSNPLQAFVRLAIPFVLGKVVMEVGLLLFGTLGGPIGFGLGGFLGLVPMFRRSILELREARTETFIPTSPHTLQRLVARFIPGSSRPSPPSATFGNRGAANNSMANHTIPQRQFNQRGQAALLRVTDDGGSQQTFVIIRAQRMVNGQMRQGVWVLERAGENGETLTREFVEFGLGEDTFPNSHTFNSSQDPTRPLLVVRAHPDGRVTLRARFGELYMGESPVLFPLYPRMAVRGESAADINFTNEVNSGTFELPNGEVITVTRNVGVETYTVEGEGVFSSNRNQSYRSVVNGFGRTGSRMKQIIYTAMDGRTYQLELWFQPGSASLLPIPAPRPVAIPLLPGRVVRPRAGGMEGLAPETAVQFPETGAGVSIQFGDTPSSRRFIYMGEDGNFYWSYLDAAGKRVTAQINLERQTLIYSGEGGRTLECTIESDGSNFRVRFFNRGLEDVRITGEGTRGNPLVAPHFRQIEVGDRIPAGPRGQGGVVEIQPGQEVVFQVGSSQVRLVRTDDGSIEAKKADGTVIGTIRRGETLDLKKDSRRTFLFEIENLEGTNNVRLRTAEGNQDSPIRRPNRVLPVTTPSLDLSRIPEGTWQSVTFKGGPIEVNLPVPEGSPPIQAWLMRDSDGRWGILLNTQDTSDSWTVMANPRLRGLDGNQAHRIFVGPPGQTVPNDIPPQNRLLVNGVTRGVAFDIPANAASGQNPIQIGVPRRNGTFGPPRPGSSSSPIESRRQELINRAEALKEEALRLRGTDNTQAQAKFLEAQRMYKEAEWLTYDRNRPPELASGQMVNAPPEYGWNGGWKLHLVVRPENYQAVHEWLWRHARELDYGYKHLHGGEPGEKDFTVYIGSRTQAQRIAERIQTELGEFLGPPSNSVQYTDMPMSPNTPLVWGRFSPEGLRPGVIIWSDFTQYGLYGIPYRYHPGWRYLGDPDPPIWEYNQALNAYPVNRLPPLEAAPLEIRNYRFYDSRAFQALQEQLGDYFTGGARSAAELRGIPQATADALVNRFERLVSEIRTIESGVSPVNPSEVQRIRDSARQLEADLSHPMFRNMRRITGELRTLLEQRTQSHGLTPNGQQTRPRLTISAITQGAGQNTFNLFTERTTGEMRRPIRLEVGEFLVGQMETQIQIGGVGGPILELRVVGVPGQPRQVRLQGRIGTSSDWVTAEDGMLRIRDADGRNIFRIRLGTEAGFSWRAQILDPLQNENATAANIIGQRRLMPLQITGSRPRRPLQTTAPAISPDAILLGLSSVLGAEVSGQIRSVFQTLTSPEALTVGGLALGAALVYKMATSPRFQSLLNGVLDWFRQPTAGGILGLVDLFGRPRPPVPPRPAAPPAPRPTETAPPPQPGTPPAGTTSRPRYLTRQQLQSQVPWSEMVRDPARDTGPSPNDPGRAGQWQYWQNMARVRAEFERFLEEWARRPDQMTDQAFENMLQGLHRSATGAVNGSTPTYTGVRDIDVQPGRFRNQADLSRQEFNSTIDPNQTQFLEYARRARELGIQDPFLEWLASAQGGGGGGAPPNLRVRIPGIPDAALPTVQGYRTTYPPPQHLPTYLRAMREAFQGILGAQRGNAPLPEIIGRIAAYYRLAINGHPFIAVNNSLLMNQVNGMLRRSGLNGIPHGGLDFLAIRLAHPESFVRLFLSEVQRANPQANLGVPVPLVHPSGVGGIENIQARIDYLRRAIPRQEEQRDQLQRLPQLTEQQQRQLEGVNRTLDRLRQELQQLEALQNQQTGQPPPAEPVRPLDPSVTEAIGQLDPSLLQGASQLGSGTFGTAVRIQRNGQPRVIKISHLLSSDMPELGRVDLISELQVAQQAQGSPHTPRVHEAYEFQNGRLVRLPSTDPAQLRGREVHAIEMDFVNGTPLPQALSQARFRDNPNLLRSLVEQMVRDLVNRGVVRWDPRSDNYFVVGEGENTRVMRVDLGGINRPQLDPVRITNDIMDALQRPQPSDSPLRSIPSMPEDVAALNEDELTFYETAFLDDGISAEFTEEEGDNLEILDVDLSDMDSDFSFISAEEEGITDNWLDQIEGEIEALDEMIQDEEAMSREWEEEPEYIHEEEWEGHSEMDHEAIIAQCSGSYDDFDLEDIHDGAIESTVGLEGEDFADFSELFDKIVGILTEWEQSAGAPDEDGDWDATDVEIGIDGDANHDTSNSLGLGVELEPEIGSATPLIVNRPPNPQESGTQESGTVLLGTGLQVPPPPQGVSPLGPSPLGVEGAPDIGPVVSRPQPRPPSQTQIRPSFTDVSSSPSIPSSLPASRPLAGEALPEVARLDSGREPAPSADRANVPLIRNLLSPQPDSLGSQMASSSGSRRKMLKPLLEPLLGTSRARRHREGLPSDVDYADQFPLTHLMDNIDVPRSSDFDPRLSSQLAPPAEGGSPDDSQLAAVMRIAGLDPDILSLSGAGEVLPGIPSQIRELEDSMT